MESIKLAYTINFDVMIESIKLAYTINFDVMIASSINCYREKNILIPLV